MDDWTVDWIEWTRNNGSTHSALASALRTANKMSLMRSGLVASARIHAGVSTENSALKGFPRLTRHVIKDAGPCRSRALSFNYAPFNVPVVS